ncbi:lysM and putative peptidoglycan-binding domain-containing protein 2-like isoform X3 [Pomacea canaliculata]|uniref:lysM and putative peptidoglycan-binding domain-containing protein 2-like isoform X3 n=1 Tax=Pomacea canaliculata TaxID=400727 RepID=UPI000D725A33|nr:lysM and putative peptidoglycan-binding domain-containing protein 2-like isoform X3 [Pomacea canaliculata]XP_025081926.1 lysM and putative peptidoglycan-binding domain-containing protein 2-like isoform X3 [Pomacea canaliculata]
MAQGGGNERETLGKFVKTQSGYGTTTSSKKHTQHKSSKFIKHMLTKEDNLVGLSLKYQCTVEVLKRENKLWNNDMLFLRDHVLIPLSPENEHLAQPEIVVTFSERERTGSVNSIGSNNPPDKETNQEVTSGKEEVQTATEVESCKKESNPLDFFSKYDSSLAKLKSDVAKMEKNAELFPFHHQ